MQPPVFDKLSLRCSYPPCIIADHSDSFLNTRIPFRCRSFPGLCLLRPCFQVQLMHAQFHVQMSVVTIEVFVNQARPPRCSDKKFEMAAS